MSDLLFVRGALNVLRARAEAIQKDFPPIRHMLVLPPGQQILSPYTSLGGKTSPPKKYLPGGARLTPTGPWSGYSMGNDPRPVHGVLAPPAKMYRFGQTDMRIQYPGPAAEWGHFTKQPKNAPAFLSALSKILPPEKFWPQDLPPFFAMEVDTTCSVAMCRRHLFFGSGRAAYQLAQLATDLIKLWPKIALARGGADESHNLICFKTSLFPLDSWLSTVHWWAWQKMESHIHGSPMVMFSGEAVPSNPFESAVTDELSFSILSEDIGTTSLATIKLFLGFLDRPPSPTHMLLPAYKVMQAAFSSKFIVQPKPAVHPVSNPPLKVGENAAEPASETRVMAPLVQGGLPDASTSSPKSNATLVLPMRSTEGMPPAALLHGTGPALPDPCQVKDIRAYYGTALSDKAWERIRKELVKRANSTASAAPPAGKEVGRQVSEAGASGKQRWEFRAEAVRRIIDLDAAKHGIVAP